MVKLTVGLTRESRVEPLIDGSVKPQNIQLDFVFGSSGEIHYRNLKYDEFDVFQMSISEFLMVKDRSISSKWQWSGLPVFLAKAFIWLGLFVNSGSRINHLDELRGKRVGMPDYPMTAALWMRIFLKEFCGMRPKDIEWYNGRMKEFSHAAIFGLDENPPHGVNINWLTANQTLDVMLDRGELDAAFGFLPGQVGTSDFGNIDRYGGTPVVGNPRIQRLFADGGRQIVTEYYKRTAVLPSNHMFLVQTRILDRYPWVAIELYKAFQKSKEVAYERARRLSSAYLLFEGQDYKSQAKVFGEDPYPLGVRDNRKMLEIIIRGSYEQGLIARLARVEDLFYPSTLDT
jgi:4,5-dihydroxyphthalate decarboxylase